MKLTKSLKDKIDQYFDTKSPGEIFSTAISKYGFLEDHSYIIDTGKLVTVPISYFDKGDKSNFEILLSDNLALAS